MTNDYIDIADYDATVHRDIIDALTRSDDALIEICEQRAISEMKSHLSARYDTEAIFAKRGDERQPLVLMMCIDITVYHIYCMGNPQKMSTIRKERYDRAVEWLKAVHRGNADIEGIEPKSIDLRKAGTLISSNTKRCNHF